MLVCFISCKKTQPKKQNHTPTPVKTELKTVLVNGDSLHYLDIGKGEPVVFVHGTIGDYRVWDAQLAAFAKNHRVIALSRRFAYPNDQTIKDSNDYSITAHAKDLVKFLKKLDIGPVHLVGHSFGAYTSLVASLEHPEILKSLTLAEPPVGSLTENLPEAAGLGAAFINNVVIPAAQAFQEGKDEKAVAFFIGGVLGDSLYYEKASQDEKDLMMDNTPELKAIASGADLFPSLSCQDFENLEIPVLLIKGERSPKNLRLIIDQLHPCIKDSELAELPNASHGLEYQNPEGFNEIVLEFIEKHRSSDIINEKAAYNDLLPSMKKTTGH